MPSKKRKRRTTLPKIDGREWHRETRAWWRRVWASPMATQFLESDFDPIFRLAVLVDDFWTADTPSLRKELSVEIRLQEARFGLSVYDRARLHWEVRTDNDDEQQAGRTPPKRPQRTEDPRMALRRVK